MKMKKLLTLIISAAMCVSAFSAAVLADENDEAQTATEEAVEEAAEIAEEAEASLLADEEPATVSKDMAVARIGEDEFPTLLAALEAASDEKEIEVTLIADAELDVTSWETKAIGGDTTEKITINGNEHKLTFNLLDSDWSHVTTKNNAKLVLNDISITTGKYNSGHWKRNGVHFNCDVEMNNIISDKLLGFKADAILKDVTVNESMNGYSVWLWANNQNVKIDELIVNAPNGRGIKIADEDAEQKIVTLEIKNSIFTTGEKSAILVSSVAGANITAENIDISNVQKDNKNIVWVDEDYVEYQNLVTVNNEVAFVEGAVATVNGVGYTDITTAFNKATDGNEVKIFAAGTYSVPTGKNITITGAVDGVVFDNIGAKNMGGASVTFNNVTFNYTNENYKGLQHSGNLVYNNCIINGQVFLYGTSETFNNCTFNQTSSNAYNVWTYGAKEVKFNECTFNSAGKSVLIYSEQSDLVNNVTVTKSTFNASAAVDGKAAIEMDSSITSGINLTIDGETTANGFGTGNVSGNSLWNNKKGNITEANNDIKVIVDDEVVLDPDAPVVVEIYDWEDFKELDAIVEAGNMLEGVTVKLMNDIDLYEMGEDGEPVTFNPIGANKAYFKGTFDGQGHTIKNMYQSGWALGYDWYNYGSIGLFAYLWDATVKNLTIENAECLVEGGNVAAIAGSAWGNCTFENITVKNSIYATYNNRAGGIVGYTGGEGTMTFKDIVVDEKTVIAGLWGSFDSSLGGLIGSIQDPTKIVIDDVSIKCRLDAYNDCTAAYKYYAYRMCGMLIGKMPVDNDNKPILDNVTITNSNVEFGKWANYTYIRNGTDNESWKRVEAGYAYDGADLSTYTNPDYNSIPFRSLFGGQQYGSYGQDEHDNVEVTFDYVVMNGDDGYWTLAEALSNSEAGDTIKILADVEEDVTIDKNITIDGADKDYTGTMTISKSINLTIDDVNFIGGNIVKGRNTGTSGTYTIKNCSFNSDSNDVYAIEIRGSLSIIIENCTSEGYYGFLQVPSSNHSISIMDVTIKDTGYSIKVDYSNGVSLENVTIENSTYGFVNSNFGGKTITVKNCAIKANYPLVIWDRSTKKVNTFKFEGDNDFGSNEFYYQTVTEDEMGYTKYVLTENATLTAVAGLDVTTELEDYVVKYNNGTYANVLAVAKIGDEKFATLAEAFAVAAEIEGTVIELLPVTITEGTVKLPATLTNVKLVGDGENTIIKNTTIMSADGNSVNYDGFTVENIIFDNSNFVFTGWRNNGVVLKNFIFKNNVFRNIIRSENNYAALHFNLTVAEAVQNFTFTGNIIDGVTGALNSGIYLTADGDVIIDNNIINNVAFRPFQVQVADNNGTADRVIVTNNTFSGSSVGRLQAYGSGTGTDPVELKVNKNIILGITDSQQICYWSFNEETTDADFSRNYYEAASPIDSEKFAKFYYNSAASSYADIIANGFLPFYTELVDGKLDDSKLYYGNASGIRVEFAKAKDADGNEIDVEGELLYDVKLVAIDSALDNEFINRLNSVDLTFEFGQIPNTLGENKYEIIDIAGDNIAVNPVDDNGRYEFHFTTKDKEEIGESDTDQCITIAQVKFTGYGEFTFGVDAAAKITNVVHTTTINDNIVDTYIQDGDGEEYGRLDVGSTIEDEIAIPTRELSVNISFPNEVEKQNADYQSMTLTVSGEDLREAITVKLADASGDTALAALTDRENAKYSVKLEQDGSYTVTITGALAKNTKYNVVLSGKGYRTAYYTVSMTENKALAFWNNVKDAGKAVEYTYDKDGVLVAKDNAETPKTTFLAGEIVNDGKINIYDLSAVVSYFGETKLVENEKYDYAKYDLNRDGIIDSRDVAYVLVSWGN